MEIDYSVIIRTTGKAKEKYRCLLTSISELKPQPKEVIVVLPEGYDLPNDKLGWESFYFSPKGMVIQRMTGIAKCKTRYALICDDDVRFDKSFVEKLYVPVAEGKCKMSVGPLYSFLTPKGARALINAVMLGAAPTIFHKNRYISIMRSTGYSYNRHLDLKKQKYYETQSAAWTCFFGEIDSIKAINFEDEIWIDSHGYSALDDQTMFYKGWLNGINTIVVADAVYEHLDAKTSTQNNRFPFLLSSGYNRVVFWHRFIYMQESNLLGKVLSILCFIYRSLWLFVYDLIDLLRKRMNHKEFVIKLRGYFNGWKYVMSNEYRKLPPVV